MKNTKFDRLKNQAVKDSTKIEYILKLLHRYTAKN